MTAIPRFHAQQDRFSVQCFVISTCNGAVRRFIQVKMKLLLVDHVHDDLLRICLTFHLDHGFDCNELRRATWCGYQNCAAAMTVSKRWRQLMRDVVEDKLRSRGAFYAKNPLLRFVALERLEEQIGLRPTRSWKAEWAELMVATMCEQHRLGRNVLEDYVLGIDFLHGDQALDDDFLDEVLDANGLPLLVGTASESICLQIFSSPACIGDLLEEEAHSVSMMCAAGFPLGLAQAYAVLTTNAREVLFESSRFGASSYFVYDGLSNMARLQRSTPIAPNVYCHLDGAFGLLESGVEWAAIKTATVGQKWVTSRVGAYGSACEDNFPDGKDDGYYFASDDSSKPVLAGRDVVCIRSALDDAGGRHNLIKELGTINTRKQGACFVLPPAAVVTLVSVQHTWRVRRQTMRCRLFTCEVAFEA